jgi:hypothetical protein
MIHDNDRQTVEAAYEKAFEAPRRDLLEFVAGLEMRIGTLGVWHLMADTTGVVLAEIARARPSLQKTVDRLCDQQTVYVSSAGARPQ